MYVLLMLFSSCALQASSNQSERINLCMQLMLFCVVFELCPSGQFCFFWLFYRCAFSFVVSGAIGDPIHIHEQVRTHALTPTDSRPLTPTSTHPHTPTHPHSPTLTLSLFVFQLCRCFQPVIFCVWYLLAFRCLICVCLDVPYRGRHIALSSSRAPSSRSPPASATVLV
jgi:hypothetical protein